MHHSAEVLARVKAPGRVGALASDDPAVGTGEAGSFDAGTVTRIQVRVDAAARRVVEARFKVFGCSAAIASASLVTERIEGAAVDDVLRLEPAEIQATLALPDERRHVAALAVAAARRAVERWRRDR
ncbi:MAG: iron-sulfur cluster assembly scaffold protein [Acidobacteriota bacterium]